MPRYYFDIDNGHDPSCDEHGMELSSRDMILRQMSRLLLDVARDELSGQERGEVTIRVRDEGAQEVCCTRLNFQTEWKKQSEEN